MADHAGFDPSRVFVYRGKGSIPRNVVRVEVDRSVKFIPAYLFDNCRQLESVLLHDGLLKIGGWAFNRCTSLIIIQIPSTVTEIGVGAFQGCSNLAAVELPEGLQSPKGLLRIGRLAFYGCTSLLSFRCPSTVNKIGGGVFYGCSNLAMVELPDGLESIDVVTFYGCTSLEEVKIPASVVRICHCAFYGCTNLASVGLCEGLRFIGESAFDGCRSLENLRVPSSVGEIGVESFDRCSSLSLVQLHEDLPKIKKDAFWGCPLESFRFTPLSDRTEAIRMDDETKSMFESRLREITLALTGEDGDDEDEDDSDDERDAEAVREKCKESLGRAHEFLTYLELKGASPVLELALWKMKIDGEGEEREQGGLVNNKDGGQDLSDAGRERKRPKVTKNIGQDTRLFHEECRVKCGAGIVLPEVLKFFAYRSSWPRLDDLEE